MLPTTHAASPSLALSSSSSSRSVAVDVVTIVAPRRVAW